MTEVNFHQNLKNNQKKIWLLIFFGFFIAASYHQMLSSTLESQLQVNTSSEENSDNKNNSFELSDKIPYSSLTPILLTKLAKTQNDLSKINFPQEVPLSPPDA